MSIVFKTGIAESEGYNEWKLADSGKIQTCESASKWRDFDHSVIAGTCT